MTQDETGDETGDVITIAGQPTAAETAAIVAVLAALSSPDGTASAAPHPAWADRARLLRVPLHPAPGAWRASALPR